MFIQYTKYGSPEDKLLMSAGYTLDSVFEGIARWVRHG